MSAAATHERAMSEASLLSPSSLKREVRQRARILHVVSCLGMGGTEHGLLKVINGLGHERFEHRICVVRTLDKDFARRMTSVELYEVGSGNAGLQFPLLRLASIMKAYRPHVVHTRNFGALEGIPASRVAGVPVAIHSEHGYELETVAGLPLRRRVMCRALFGMADAVFTVTENLRAYHAAQSWTPEQRLRVIYNGVDLETFTPSRTTAEETRHRYCIPADRIVIGSVGRLVPIKNQATLLRAAEMLAENGCPIHVVLVGDGKEAPALKKQAAESAALQGRVTFAGTSDRVSDLLSAMDIFVLPSISEGMSNTILEAMATALPVVVSRTGGNPELVDEGRSGYLFRPTDPRSLAGALGRLVQSEELRRGFGESAREAVVARFSLSGMIQRYDNLYRELMSVRNIRVDI